MQLYMVRHAHAGHRFQNGRDVYRTLSADGKDRAAALVELFAGQPIDRLLSSPATRCVQTLEPLAAERGLEVRECRELWEGSSIDDALAAVGNTGAEAVVACSHGDVIPAVIDALGSRGVPISGRGCELGSVWILEHDGSDWCRARYLSTKEWATGSISIRDLMRP